MKINTRIAAAVVACALLACGFVAVSQTTGGKTYVTPQLVAYDGNPNCSGTNVQTNVAANTWVYVSGTYNAGTAAAAGGASIPDGVFGNTGDVVVDRTNGILWIKTGGQGNTGWVPQPTVSGTSVLKTNIYGAGPSPLYPGLITLTGDNLRINVTGTSNHGILLQYNSATSLTSTCY